MRKKKHTRRYEPDFITPIKTFTMTGVGIPVSYGILGAGASISPAAGLASVGVANQMGTAFNLMGTTGMIQSAIPVFGSLHELGRITKKR